jgi:hypothetical protein
MLGFPWILSSESRFINGLRGIFRNFFSYRFYRREIAVETAGPRFRTARERIAHGDELNFISDFLQ